MTTVVDPTRDIARARRGNAIETALRADWRMIEKVEVYPRGACQGLRIDVFLNAVLVRGSAEQRGLIGPYLEANPRIRTVVGECVERLNGTLPADEQIISFQIIE